MAYIYWPADFSCLMGVAARHEQSGQYRAAWETYLLAASRAPDALGEDIALTYGWWAYEQERGRTSELRSEGPASTGEATA